ncbi:MAG TPA: malto-oligosyltrehalose trehalohydrolase [Reyranella sp.]|jgi:malto-oligosyltrehalose trehalohydrolase|nr:malto-oligosyltrehalose trehalohydrolase [Reyranella sp.]
MTTFAHRFPFGATWMGNRRTHFKLWAPGQRHVDLVIEGRSAVGMQFVGDGWFEADADCLPGASYRYRLESGQLVPDPASRQQAADVHGPSVVVDPATYDWRHADWRGRPWRETVLYELHVGTYGGFQAVAADLDRLATLGVTALELMPISDFSGARNWGYDGVLPFAPHRAYGTPDELKALIDAAHARRLMVFLDVVYNHFGPDGNYLGSYAPQFFRDDVKTPWGAAIDFRQPPVRRFFVENALYWLMEYRFDGLRFDAAHAIGDQNWLDEMAGEIRRTVEKGRHVHLVLEHDENDARHLRRGYDAQWNDDAHHALHVLLTGESDGYYGDYAQAPARQLARCLSEGFAFQGEPSAYRGNAPRGRPSADLPPTSFVLFLQNHDQVGNRPFGNRLTAQVSPEALRAAATLQLLCPQIPLLFMGEEWQSQTPFLFFTDYQGPLADAVRNGRRSEFKRFVSFDGDDIPDPNAIETFTHSRFTERGDDSFYRQLLALRQAEIVPHLAGTRALGASAIGPTAVVARWRIGDRRILEIAANLGAEPCEAPTLAGKLVFSSRFGEPAGGTLPGFCTAVHIGPAA